MNANCLIILMFTKYRQPKSPTKQPKVNFHIAAVKIMCEGWLLNSQVGRKNSPVYAVRLTTIHCSSVVVTLVAPEIRDKRIYKQNS